MAEITYVEFDGKAHLVEVKPGASVMQGAVRNGVPGIVAECGGDCSCATCHVFVDDAWLAKVGPPGDAEQSLLDFVDGAGASSRLSCQIKVSDALHGLVVRMPETQG
jgi:2Fe-2S ferredoxin